MKRQLVPLTLALVVLAALPVAAAAPTEISVTGSGSVAMMPDQATVNAQVQTTADTSAAAVDQNNRRYDAIVAAATRAGVARADITLSYYSMNYVPKPNPMPTGDTYERYGYTVTRSFAVKVRQIGKAGSVVDALSGAGATSIDGVAFGLANPQRARAQATERAVADARTKAEEIAKAAGLHIASIKSIALEGAPGPIVRPMIMAKAAQAAPTQFDAGSVNVTVDVGVIFSAVP